MDIQNFPFKRIAARAVILRRDDGCLLGVLHRPSGRYAPPGGGVLDGESPETALMRELEEECIRLIDPDANWKERLAVDYYSETGSLNLWYVFLVEDVQVGKTKEIIDCRWLDQTQDVWYPQMREKIILAIEEFVPDLLKVNVSVLESW